MPKSKRMFNNASSALNENEMIQMLISNNCETNDESKMLISKHNGLRTTFLNKSKPNQNELNIVDQEYDLNNPDASNFQQEPKDPIICSQFTPNQEILKIMMRYNFPPRFPTRLESQDQEASILNNDTDKTLMPVQTTETQMMKSFLKFWNRVITRQDICTRSVLNHQLTKSEAGYYPCQLKDLFNAPESYLKKPFCHKSRYTGPGYQLLPSSNQFSRISKRTLLKLEVNNIFQYYSNPSNHYYLIPVEFSSKLSRSMLRSVEICQNNEGCNKLTFVCNPRNATEQVCHPLFTIEFKSSIEDEILPCANLSLLDNFPTNRNVSGMVNPNLYHALFNYTYLSHFLYRQDFSIDNFFSRCWHFSRYFCNKLDLGGKINNVVSVSIKDSIFNFLLSSSARLCIAIKYWVLNPDYASYFRCWCGHRIYDAKQESKLLRKFPVGSVKLFNHQQKVQQQEMYHKKHSDRKSQSHICACNRKFRDHQSWFAHALSPKISDVSKICPIVLFNISKVCDKENRFVCECNDTFSDYDFWSFWIHLCGCKTFRIQIKQRCHCGEKHKEQKLVAPLKISTHGTKRSHAIRKRKRSIISPGLSKTIRRIMKKPRGDSSQHSDYDEPDTSLMNMNKSKKIEKSQMLENGSDGRQSDDGDWQSGDNINLPLKLTSQLNSNETQSSRRSSKRKITENK